MGLPTDPLIESVGNEPQACSRTDTPQKKTQAAAERYAPNAWSAANKPVPASIDRLSLQPLCLSPARSRRVSFFSENAFGLDRFLSVGPFAPRNMFKLLTERSWMDAWAFLCRER
jgi:hypothetical protein